MSDTQQTRWVDLVEAAGHFDRSERTIRRWIKAGDLSSKRTGGRLYVEISDTVTDTEPAKVDTSDTSAKVAELSDTVAKLSAKLSAAAAERDQVADERDYLRQALAAALSKIPQIEATASAGDEKPPRRWWQFWK